MDKLQYFYEGIKAENSIFIVEYKEVSDKKKYPLLRLQYAGQASQEQYRLQGGR